MFTDKISLKAIAGKGGNGIIAWTREKYIPKGGPCGGNGGRGGSVIFQGHEGLLSLEDLRHTRRLVADNGKNGGTNNCQGACGEDIIIHVPCGTLITDKITGELYCDISEHHQQFIACEGGRGGKGNAFYRNSVNQAPYKKSDGDLGEEKELTLELKLIADVGLLGLPNAGKSTLISSICGVRAKIGAYPFTTLKPNIGVYKTETNDQIIFADVPGIVPNAHQNKGLGLEFLRHIERTKALIFVLDASAIDGISPEDAFLILKHEIEQYGKGISSYPYIIALNKCDQLTDDELLEIQQSLPQDAPCHIISAKEKVNLETITKWSEQQVLS